MKQILWLLSSLLIYSNTCLLHAMHNCSPSDDEFLFDYQIYEQVDSPKYMIFNFVKPSVRFTQSGSHKTFAFTKTKEEARLHLENGTTHLFLEALCKFKATLKPQSEEQKRCSLVSEKNAHMERFGNVTKLVVAYKEKMQAFDTTFQDSKSVDEYMSALDSKLMPNPFILEYCNREIAKRQTP